MNFKFQCSLELPNGTRMLFLEVTAAGMSHLEQCLTDIEFAYNGGIVNERLYALLLTEQAEL